MSESAGASDAARLGRGGHVSRETSPALRPRHPPLPPPRRPPRGADHPAPAHPRLGRRGSAGCASRDRSWLVIETAGALLSPLAHGPHQPRPGKALEPDTLVLVAPDRLGVLHDVTAALLALRTLAPELPPPVVVLQPPATPDSSTGTNAAGARALGIAGQVAAFPRADVDASETQAAAVHLLRMVDARPEDISSRARRRARPCLTASAICTPPGCPRPADRRARFATVLTTAGDRASALLRASSRLLPI